MEHSRIIVHVIRNMLGQLEQVTYEWCGRSPYTVITSIAMRDMGIIETENFFILGPYRLIKMEYRPQTMEWLCVRADRLGTLRVFVYRATRWLDWFYRRSIVVLAIYGAADYQQYQIPSWRDIHALKWMAKVVKSIKTRSMK